MSRSRFGRPEVDEMIRRLSSDGHAISRTAAGHVRIDHRDGGHPLLLPGTPGTHRISRIVRSWQRRSERSVS